MNVRTWARGVATDFDIDLLGQVKRIDYSDPTPDVTFSAPDAKGRYTIIADGQGTRTLARGPRADSLPGEDIPGK